MEKGNTFYNTVLRTVSERRLFRAEDRVLVAVSGGADSVALLLVLLQMGIRCDVAHCNFHLRGEESDRDEAFVRSLCRKCGVHLYVEDFDTAAYAQEKGISIEMAARDLRYAYFEQLRADLAFDCVAVAHHRDDNVETFLLNLIRGTGLKGLTGMPYRNGHVVRPLLDTSRADIERYLSARGQVYVTDSTNLVADVMRNKIRLELLPMLQAMNPSIVGTLQDTIRHLEDAYTLYGLALEGLEANLCRDGRISIRALKAAPAAHTVLFELLRAYGFNSEQAEDIYEHLDGEAGKVYESQTWRLLRDREDLILSRKDEVYRCQCNVLPLEGFVKVAPDLSLSIRRAHYDSHFVIPREKDTACLDLDKIAYPITIRLVEAGDRFVPFGMKGQKLVSDYLTDAKKTLFEKERQLVVCSGEQIAWLVGERADERFRVGDTTSRVLVIQCLREGGAL